MNTKPEVREVTSVRLTPTMRQRLLEAARERGTTVTALIEQGLEVVLAQSPAE